MRKVVLLILCGTCLLMLLTGLALLWWLKPGPGEWQQRVGVGPVVVNVSVERAVGLLSRAGVALLFDGRNLASSAGIWRVHATRGHVIELVCEPCRLQHRSLGPLPLRMESVVVGVKRQGGSDYAGTLRLASRTRALSLEWSAHLDAQGATILVDAATLSIADLLAVLGQEVAETRFATVTGTLAVSLRLRLPAGTLDTQLHLDGFAVSGLGTERLLHVALPENCGGHSPSRITGWLPVAVIAAEDQKFASHPGYDAGQIAAAARGNQNASALSGASTLTQQLARLLYTGAERSPQRKLRELLYAVEMERTLGKARILQLYLALAPWGSGVCGAEHAAQRYLGKPASTLTPAEAAWLASLLTNPDALLGRQAAGGGIDLLRPTRILQDMRPMSARRRQRALLDLAALRPPVLEQIRGAATFQPEPAAPAPPPDLSAAGPGRSGTQRAPLLAHRR